MKRSPRSASTYNCWKKRTVIMNAFQEWVDPTPGIVIYYIYAEEKNQTVQPSIDSVLRKDNFCNSYKHRRLMAQLHLNPTSEKNQTVQPGIDIVLKKR